MKHKLKRIFNRRIFSRALITVITCSIIFSYAVLCPQAGETILEVPLYVNTDYTTLPGFQSSNLPSTSFLGDFLNWPENNPSYSYYIYDPTVSTNAEIFNADLWFKTDSVFENLNTHNNIFVGIEIWYCATEQYFPDNYGIHSFYFESSNGDRIQIPLVVQYTTDTFNDDFTGQTVYRFQCMLYADNVDKVFSTSPYYLTYGFNVPLYIAGSSIGYDTAVIAFANIYYEYDVVEADVLSDIYNQVYNINGTVIDIQNSLTNVTPQMQESINKLETLIQDEQEKIEDVITEMDKIDTDFGTQIGDFDDILNDNADTLENIGSTTYNSFINDVFGNWFFVSMFALFGAFAFFSRAVFG